MKLEHCTSNQHPKWFTLAVQALVILSQEKINIACPSVEIAAVLQAEPSLLRRILAVLMKEGLLNTREGRDGGYWLKQAPDSITLAEVYEAFRKESAVYLGIKENVNSDPFGGEMKAFMENLATEIDQSLLGVLSRYTIADVAGRVSLHI
jgi:Rrf2 family transcriptional repressor of oqxAB